MSGMRKSRIIASVRLHIASRSPTSALSAVFTSYPSRRSVRANVSVGIRYIAAWLSGVGAAAIDNLMEDAATAEISRSQVWQWVHHGRVARADVERTIAEISAELPADPVYGEARELFEQLALADNFTEFLTLPAYERLLERF